MEVSEEKTKPKTKNKFSKRKSPVSEIAGKIFECLKGIVTNFDA